MKSLCGNRDSLSELRSHWLTDRGGCFPSRNSALSRKSSIEGSTISGGPFGSGFNHRAATWTADRSVNESERSVIPEMLEIPRVQIDHRNRLVAVL